MNSLRRWFLRFHASALREEAQMSDALADQHRATARRLYERAAGVERRLMLAELEAMDGAGS